MGKKIQFAMLLLWAFILSGCASQQLKANIPDGVKPSNYNSFYVIHQPNDNRRLDKTISEELKGLGYNATYGEERDIPNKIDAIVRYEDRWQWDITNYLISLTITMRQSDETLIATGKSFRTSLVRKEPPEMIREILNEIFSKNKS